MAQPNKQVLNEIHMKMLLTRKFEEKVAYFFSMGKIHGTTHLYIGEEAVAAGVCSALDLEDLITSTHRGHGHCISKGIDLNGMMAELLGKRTGTCKGKGGSMHIADISRGNLGANGVVGGGQPIAVGAALALRMRKKDNVVVCFFGDGASNTGTFHESLNLAAVWKLPVLFVCENNQYAVSTPVSYSVRAGHISDRAAGYGMPGKTIDGNDAVLVYEETLKAVEQVKKNGPILLECITYRYMGHSKSDANVYRTREEIDEWKQRDPIMRMEQCMLENGFTAREIEQNKEKAAQEIEDAVAFAEKSEYPDRSEILDYIYV
ncbi:acetoin:2,6-dichlorophenolindophenol oxidoreductase subunit alpha [Christensenellaceae bacterium]|nr:acetoin:2,6-dichlorophenolindophenol oxidoreductase subunit alpha [Christensenellaceae bacterium]BDF62278.1 acetoin:2,6-dichlorophenolindophenol oxidoreductase subunit alpha [Christensenellaceae bacterium]